MTSKAAIALMYEYQELASGLDDVLYGIGHRFPINGSVNKAMRWLGFCQGVLLERRVFTLEETKEHSRRGYVK